MANILEREKAEMVIEKWLFDNIETKARLTIDASHSGGYCFDIYNHESNVSGAWADDINSGIQDIAKLITDLEGS